MTSRLTAPSTAPSVTEAKLKQTLPEITVEQELAMVRKNQRLLRRGSAGQAVRAWQESLNTWLEKSGREKIAVTGIFDSATTQATASFQGSWGFDGDFKLTAVANLTTVKTGPVRRGLTNRGALLEDNIVGACTMRAMDMFLERNTLESTQFAQVTEPRSFFVPTMPVSLGTPLDLKSYSRPLVAAALSYMIKRDTDGEAALSAQDYLDVSDETGVPLEVLGMMTKLESRWGTRGMAVRTRNPGNVGNNGNTGKQTFMASPKDGLRAMANLLATSYGDDTGVSAEGLIGRDFNRRGGGRYAEVGHYTAAFANLLVEFRSEMRELLHNETVAARAGKSAVKAG